MTPAAAAAAQLGPGLPWGSAALRSRPAGYPWGPINRAPGLSPLAVIPGGPCIMQVNVTGPSWHAGSRALLSKLTQLAPAPGRCMSAVCQPVNVQLQLQLGHGPGPAGPSSWGPIPGSWAQVPAADTRPAAAGPWSPGNWPRLPGPGPRVECRHRFPGSPARGSRAAARGPRSLASRALARFWTNIYRSKVNWLVSTNMFHVKHPRHFLKLIGHLILQKFKSEKTPTLVLDSRNARTDQWSGTRPSP
jgi:hypothetical protein